MLYERTKQMKLLEIKLADFKNLYEQSLHSMRENENSLQAKDHQLSKIQLELASTTNVQEEQLYELQNGFGESVFDKARERETQALKFAKQTVVSLQRQIHVKDELVSKYREMLKTIRREHSKKDAENNTILEKNAIINSMTQREIQRLEVVQDPKESKVKDLVPELEMIEELEKNVAAKDLALMQLQRTVEKNIKDLEAATNELAQVKQKFEEAQLEKDAILLEKNASIENLERDLEQTQNQLTRTPPKKLTDDVARLEQENAKKDFKLKGFSSVVQELKLKLIKTAKELAESKVNNSNNAYAAL
jgi:centrosomal protein CEP290